MNIIVDLENVEDGYDADIAIEALIDAI